MEAACVLGLMAAASVSACKGRYRGYWFWVDNKDWQTKRTLTAIMFFFTLAEAGGGEKLPMITIPAQ